MKCIHCGKEFDANGNRKYCSLVCQKDAHRIKEKEKRSKEFKKWSANVHCVYCGKKFEPVSRKQKYCSNECMTKLYKDIRDKMAEARGIIIHNCEICGKEYKPFSARQKYCSTDCSREAYKRASRKVRHIKIIEPKKKKPPTLSISDICRLAREEHMSYGKYVAKYGL